MMHHEKYMQRCIELASLGAGYVAPNPMVGGVLVFEDRIIGEGYHRLFGGPHAEVHAIDAVPDHLRDLLTQSTLYVSLEPCAHFGKTPPCADLIIQSKIPRVVVGCRDPFPQVDGKGIEKLREAGVEVTVGVMEQACLDLNKRFFTFHKKHRPYIVLKWAETADGKIGYYGSNRLHITNAFTNRLVHKWRSEESAIMVGTTTAALDDPQLTNRLWCGTSPARIVVDYHLKLPSSLRLFDGSNKTIVFNTRKHGEEGSIFYYQVTEDVQLVHQVVHALYQLRILSVIIEGGARLTQSFIDEGYWDEARVITNEELYAGSGVAAPVLHNGTVISSQRIGTDFIRIYKQ